MGEVRIKYCIRYAEKLREVKPKLSYTYNINDKEIFTNVSVR